MKRILAGLAMVLVLAAVVVLLVSSSSGGSSDPTYKIELDNAFGLVNGASFKVAGVNAGTIKSIDLDQRTLHAVVVIDVTQAGFGSFHADAFCQSRPQSLIGEYYVSCDPGHGGKALKSGSTIPVTHTQSTIPADLLQNVLRLPYRQRLSLIINELGAAVAGRSGDLQAALRRAVPALTETDNLLNLLGNDSHTLQQLTVNSDSVITALANNSAQGVGYALIVGSTMYGSDLVASGVLRPTQTSYNVGALPVGVTLHATLFTEIAGTWAYQASTFTAAPGEATITFPLNGQIGVDPTKAFTWATITQAQGYVLVVGTSPFGTNIVNSGVLPATQTSFATPTLPAGKALYATLLTKVSGAFTRFQAIAFTTGPARGSLTRPVNGEHDVPTPSLFTWSTIVGAEHYDLIVGTTLYGTDLVSSPLLPPTQSSFAVPALPHSTIYVTLFTEVDGTWTFEAATFSAG